MEEWLTLSPIILSDPTALAISHMQHGRPLSADCGGDTYNSTSDTEVAPSRPFPRPPPPPTPPRPSLVLVMTCCAIYVARRSITAVLSIQTALTDTKQNCLGLRQTLVFYALFHLRFSHTNFGIIDPDRTFNTIKRFEVSSAQMAFDVMPDFSA